MFRKSKVVARLGVLAVAGLLVAGCGATSTGGGVGPSALQGGARATYGFQLSCNAHTNMVYGQLAYHDHGTNSTYPAGVAIHGTLPMMPVSAFSGALGTTVTTCAQLDAVSNTILHEITGITFPPGVQLYYGTYTPQTTTPEPGGAFIIYLEGTKAAGLVCGVGQAAFGISLTNGVYAGYSNEFCAPLGNITVH